MNITTTSRRRSGKVARLPLQQRNLINQWLRDGFSYQEIIEKFLEKHPEELGLAWSNIGQWARGGYREWLAQQEHHEKTHPLNPAATALLGQMTPDGHAQSDHLSEYLLSLIAQSIQELDPQAFFALLTRDPVAFFRMTERLISHRAATQRDQLENKKFELTLTQDERAARSDRQAELRRLGRQDALNQILEMREQHNSVQKNTPK